MAKAIGEKSDTVTTEVFSGAKRRISGEFERLSQQNDLTPTPELASQLSQLSDEASRLGGSDTSRMVKGWVTELVKKADENGVIPGKAYQSFDSRLGKVIKAGGEPAYYLGNLREAVRSAMDDSIKPADRAAWQTARQQYAALKTIEPIVAKSPTGDIPAAALLQRTTADKAGKARMAMGEGGELGELARIGNRFLKEPPNSGTPDRALVNTVAATGGAGLLTYLSPTVAASTAGTVLGNRGLLSFLNSQGVTQGNSRSLKAIAGLSRPLPRLLPATSLGGTSASFDIGTAYGYDRNDPRYRGD